MKSINYTYERRQQVKTVDYGGDIRIGYKAWVILSPKGRKIAEATSEEKAELIVSALNGTA